MCSTQFERWHSCANTWTHFPYQAIFSIIHRAFNGNIFFLSLIPLFLPLFGSHAYSIFLNTNMTFILKLVGTSECDSCIGISWKAKLITQLYQPNQFIQNVSILSSMGLFSHTYPFVVSQWNAWLSSLCDRHGFSPHNHVCHSALFLFY